MLLVLSLIISLKKICFRILRQTKVKNSYFDKRIGDWRYKNTCNHSSKDLPCHSSTFTWLYSLSRLYFLGNNIIESSFVNQGWRNASSALRREPGGYSRNCCRRFKTKSSEDALLLVEVVAEWITEDKGRLGRRGESGTAGTMLKTTLFAPGSSSNSYCGWFFLKKWQHKNELYNQQASSPRSESRISWKYSMPSQSHPFLH